MRIAGAMAALAIAGAAVFGMAAPANAGPEDDKDGFCDTGAGEGELCHWKLADFQGSMIDRFQPDPNYADDFFITPGEGQGQSVANNSISILNFDAIQSARVYTGPNGTGDAKLVLPMISGGNLEPPSFRNNLESHLWLP